MLIVGHRGASGSEPENTIRAFDRALSMGADMIELDVHICSSGELVVIHDSTLERTTNGSGEVREHTYSELEPLDAGKGERVPRFASVLDRFLGRIGLNIELKGEGTGMSLAREMDGLSLQNPGPVPALLVSSFKPMELMDLRSARPDIPVGVLFEESPDVFLDFAEELGAWAVHPRMDVVSEGLVKETHRRNLRCITWTINSRIDMEKAVSLNVDGMITDHPDRLLDWLGDRDKGAGAQ